VVIGNKPSPSTQTTTVARELVVGLRVVFVVFTKDVGADVQGTGLLFCLVD
jgi:hypothetical protein